MRGRQRETYYIAGSRIFIRDLIDEGKYSRMPNIKIIEDVIDGKPGFDMQCLNGKGLFTFKIDHCELNELDIAEGFEHFMYECINASMDPEYYALMRRATGILRKHGYEERKEMYNDDVYYLIEAADKCRKEIVLCLLGKPGIGKTEAVERFARDHNRNVVHIIASQIMPNEVSGMTMPNQETRSMDVFDHYRLSHMKDGDILFFDELLKGQQQVLNACLTLIQERRLMSGTKLPDVLIIAAANPLASASQLPPEIRQRFLFHKVEWKSDRWIKYMQDLGFDDCYDMKNLIREIEHGLTSSMSDWNVLTPRTATKLCLWMRETNCDPIVREYIGREFGRNVSEMIYNLSMSKETMSPQMQIADTVLEVLTGNKIKYEERGNTAGYNESEEYSKFVDAIDKAREIKEKGDEDLSGLLAMLEGLPIWDQIQDVLRNTKIE